MIAAACFVTPNSCGAQTYWVLDRGELRPAYDDPARLAAKEWHVRLYRAGETPVGRNYWGVETGQSAAEVMERLKASQNFERRYERWCQCPRGASTHFNPVGPIAVISRSQTSVIVGTALRIKAAYDQFGKVRTQINAWVFNKPKPPNPYEGIGRVALDYGRLVIDRLEANLQQISDLTRRSARHGGEVGD